MATAALPNRPRVVRVAAVLAFVAAAIFALEGAAGLAYIPGGDGAGAQLAPLSVFAFGLAGFLVAGAVRLWRGMGRGVVLTTLFVVDVSCGGYLLNLTLQMPLYLPFVVLALVNLAPSLVALALVLRPGTAKWLASDQPDRA